MATRVNQNKIVIKSVSRWNKIVESTCYIDGDKYVVALSDYNAEAVKQNHWEGNTIGTFGCERKLIQDNCA